MASQSNDTSVEDAVKKMTCDELIKALRREIPDERYKADLQILEEESIDGELFLTLPDDPDLKEVFDKLRGGGKAKIRKVVRGIKDGSLKFGQADSSQKLVEPDMPWCTTQTPDDTVNGAGDAIAATDHDGHNMQKAWMPLNAVWTWKDHKIIYVEFRNVGLLAGWTIGDGQPMNTITILHYANKWSDMGGGEIPRFVEVQNGGQAQIRVSFNNNQLRDSSLGKRAQNIPVAEPTMNLDLHNGCPSNAYKIHLIRHEFGHALGLGHEHQRSIFWSCIKPHTDIKMMKKDLGVTEKQFAIDWKEIDTSEAGHHTPDYDPDSIMHYWFKVKWLTNGYSDKKKVEKDHKNGILTDKVAAALLGVHKRRGVLPVEPSPLDIQLLKQVYGGGGGTQTGGEIAIEPDDDDHVAAGGPSPRIGLPSEKRRITADSGVKMTEESSVTVVAKKPKVDPAEEESELMFEQEYDVEVTNAHLSRMSWNENGKNKKQVVKIYDEASHKWHEIGQNLGIDNGILVGIGRDGRDERDRVVKVLGRWYENACGLPHYDDYPRTWGGLLRLLDNSDLGHLARKVQTALLQQKKPNGRVMSGGPQAPVNGGQGSDLIAKDLNKVYNAVRGARSQWYHIGLALGIEADDLDAIQDSNRANPDKCLTDVLIKFLRQVSPRPSWKQLADAMASPSVGRGDIAADLREQHSVC